VVPFVANFEEDELGAGVEGVLERGFVGLA